jgi:hypothetical protein
MQVWGREGRLQRKADGGCRPLVDEAFRPRVMRVSVVTEVPEVRELSLEFASQRCGQGARHVHHQRLRPFSYGFNGVATLLCCSEHTLDCRCKNSRFLHQSIEVAGEGKAGLARFDDVRLPFARFPPRPAERAVTKVGVRLDAGGDLPRDIRSPGEDARSATLTALGHPVGHRPKLGARMVALHPLRTLTPPLNRTRHPPGPKSGRQAPPQIGHWISLPASRFGASFSFSPGTADVRRPDPRCCPGAVRKVRLRGDR